MMIAAEWIQNVRFQTGQANYQAKIQLSMYFNSWIGKHEENTLKQTTIERRCRPRLEKHNEADIGGLQA